VLDDKGGVAFILNQVIDVTSRRAPLRQNEAGSLNALPGQAAHSPSRQRNP
jgi:hypothetical protein